MIERAPRDVTFPVNFCGVQHWGVRVGTKELPMYFSQPIEADVHLALMKYRRAHDGEMPADLERFAAEHSGQRRGDRAP